MLNPFASPKASPSARGRQLVASGARLLDVRTPEEFAGGHIAGALNIPVQQLAARLREVAPPGTPVVVYCRSGARSAAATQLLRSANFGEIVDLGAMTNW